MNDKWLNDLRDRMADYREPVPENLWDGIAQELERGTAPVTPRRNVTALWIRRSAAAAMLALALAAGYKHLSRTETPDLIAESGMADADDIAGGLPSADAAAVRAGISPSAHKPQPVRLGLAAALTATAGTAAATDIIISNEVPRPTPAESIAETRAESPSDRDSRQPIRRLTDGAPKSRPTAKSPASAPAQAAVPAKSRLTADIYMSGLAGSSCSRRSDNGTMMLSAGMYRQISERADPMADPLDDPLTLVMLYNRNAQVDTETRHRQPLRFGFSLRCMITPSIGIESGLAYTLLMSTVKSGGKECYYDEERTLHYIGIPVNLVWNAWSGERLTFYLSGGASVEKCVSGRSGIRYVLHGRTVSSERRSIGIAQLQWSVAAAAGVQYNISRRTGLYIEPGVGYYFDNGSETETAYSRRPLNFNLNMGVRISFR